MTCTPSTTTSCATVAELAPARRPRDLHLSVSGSHVNAIIRGSRDDIDTVEAKRELRSATAVLIAVRNVGRLVGADAGGTDAAARRAQLLTSIDVPPGGYRPSAKEAAIVRLLAAELGLPTRAAALVMLGQLLDGCTLERLRAAID